MKNNCLTSALATWQNWGVADKAPKLEDLQPLAGGLTNKGYLLRLNKQKFVLRLAAPNSANLNINRSAELALQQFLSSQHLDKHDLAKQNLAAKVIYVAADNSFWLREYVAGKPINLPKQADVKLELAIKLAQHLQLIHQLEIPANLAKQLTHISIEEKAAAYWQAIKPENLSQQELANLEQLQERLSLLTAQQVVLPNNKAQLCHLDPTLANWLITPNQQLHLLDWEYAGLGNPLWDFAQLSQAFNLNEPEEKQLLASLGYLEKGYLATDYTEESQLAWQLAKLEMRYLNSLWFATQKSDNYSAL